MFSYIKLSIDKFVIITKTLSLEVSILKELGKENAYKMWNIVKDNDVS